MLTRLIVRNFKRFGESDIPLGRAVVFIGPNNSGKTTALQALALWETGVKAWLAKRSGRESAGKRSGVTINRKDLIAIAMPNANLLWRDLHVREGMKGSDGRPKTRNVLIHIVVEGVYQDQPWRCGLEFDYANPESFYCRPLLAEEGGGEGDRLPIPPAAGEVRVAFLPPMSGLASVEPKLEGGRINVLIGEGRTAEVLRNLCWRIYEKSDGPWLQLVQQIRHLFGVELLAPEYVATRGEIGMSYREGGIELDLSSGGRGLQQTLLLLAYLHANPHTAILLDEPDAHLEILRQRQIYQLITEIAACQGCQVIAASHSEIVLNEAAGRDEVIAFIGRPHPIADRKAQLLKALQTLGFDQYLLAEETGWVLYLEGNTDLAILQRLAEKLEHPAREFLARPFVHYIATNQPQLARDHFNGLKEAKPDLLGLALFDRLQRPLQQNPESLVEVMWRHWEIENYLCHEEALLAFARGAASDDIFSLADATHREARMRECIGHLADALETLGKPDPWSEDIKASDEFLLPLFERYLKQLALPANTFSKRQFHELVEYLPVGRIDPEITEKLDLIVATAQRAKPRQD